MDRYERWGGDVVSYRPWCKERHITDGRGPVIGVTSTAVNAPLLFEAVATLAIYGAARRYA